MPPQRLQKILSAAGIASRRQAEELIAQGRVEVDDKVVETVGARADPDVDDIRVDGEPVRIRGERIYLLLNKPRGYVSTLHDTNGRPTVRDLLPKSMPRVYHVGRLDMETEGLLLLTDDGELANRVTHPRYGCAKVYLAKVRGQPKRAALEQLRRGVALDGERTAPARVEVVRSTRRDGNTWLELTLTEGRSRQVRRMLHAVGHGVTKLKRVRIGSLEDRGLKTGEYRELTADEVRGLAERAARPTPRTAKRRPTLSARAGRGRTRAR